jgi:hypothetical protein
MDLGRRSAATAVPPVLIYWQAVQAADGPRKGFSSPEHCIRSSSNLTSSPSIADPGKLWKEGVYGRREAS